MKSLYNLALKVLVIIVICVLYLRGYPVTTNNECVEKSGALDPVEKRIQESHENWLKSLKERKRLENQYPLDTYDQWSYRGGINFFDFFYPSFDCPYTTERVGRSGDGGKWICGFHYIAKRSKNQSCVVYSYGVNNEWSFDKEVLERSNCKVYMYDPTININRVPLPKQFPQRAFIEQMGLGPTDDELNANISKRTRSLKTQMEKNGHTFIDILKMDIEGAEFEILQSFNKEFPNGPPFGQMVAEIHLPMEPYPNLYQKILAPWMKALEDMGLRPYRYEINPGAVFSSKRHTPHCWEYSFINVKFDHYLLHDEKYEEGSSGSTKVPKMCKS